MEQRKRKKYPRTELPSRSCRWLLAIGSCIIMRVLDADLGRTFVRNILRPTTLMLSFYLPKVLPRLVRRIVQCKGIVNEICYYILAKFSILRSTGSLRIPSLKGWRDWRTSSWAWRDRSFLLCGWLKEDCRRHSQMLLVCRMNEWDNVDECVCVCVRSRADQRNPILHRQLRRVLQGKSSRQKPEPLQGRKEFL